VQKEFWLVKRLLITTALEETWGDGQPVLFLGEWCRRYSLKDHWSKMDAEVLPYHWNDRAKLYADYQYLREFYERLLRDLSAQLNQIHGVNHSLRYWRILIGPWLGIFIPLLFDRWASIQSASSEYDLSGTVILVDQAKTLIPKDMDGFMHLFPDDEWNCHLYGAILQEFTSVPCHMQERPESDSILKVVPAESWRFNLKSAIKNCYYRTLGLFASEQDVFFLNTYLSHFDEIRLCQRLKEIPRFWPLVPAVRTAVDMSQRQSVVPGESRSDFEACARALVPKQIPSAYLEGYEQICKQVMDLPWPKRPKMIWTSNSHISNDVFKAWSAEKTECGSPLVIGQHGGHYGIGLWSFNEDHELSISDYYLSWGWFESGRPKIKPVGQLKSRLPLGGHPSKQERALLVTCTVPRYGYPTRSIMVAGQYLDYFSDQGAFVENLPNHIFEKLTVRLNQHDYGWDQTARWLDRFPNIQLDEDRSSIDDLIRQSKLYISTYNATTFLESLTMNMPSVIYWNMNHWELRESAVPYFEELKRVGIFHESPESAAQHVTAIWDDVDAWWASPAVQKVLKNFKERYCHVDNMLDRVEATLRSVMAETKYPSPSAMEVEKVSSDML
jgi:putative transferase (TIGR04331 family)